MFGPLFYTTVVISVLITIFAEFTIHESAITAYLTERSLRQQEQALIAELQSDIPKVRQMAARRPRADRSKAVVPYLLEAARDPHSELRILAFRHLTELDVAREAMVPVLIAAASDPDVLLSVSRPHLPLAAFDPSVCPLRGRANDHIRRRHDPGLTCAEHQSRFELS